MGLQRFERGLERLVEGVFSKAFRSGLQPVELGRRLAREMDLRRSVGVNGMVAPNHYEITLSEADNERFSSFIDALKRELVESVREHARTERYTFMGPVAVVVNSDSRLNPGALRVKGSVQEQPGGGPMGTLVLADDRRIELSDKPVVIGRLPDCDVSVVDQNISRRHAEIRRHGNDFIIVDLKSTNGTKVNGNWVSGERRLHDGDEIVVGGTSIKFEGS